MDPNQQNQNDEQNNTPPPPQPGQQVDANPPAPAPAPPPRENIPPPPQAQPEPQTQQQPPQELQNEQPQQTQQQEDEVPDYLQGAGPPPGPGQAMHPPGGYQAKPGEVVQRSAAGGAVVQNVDQDGNTRSSVYAPPSVPQPSQPTQQVDATPTGYTPQYGQNTYQQNEQSGGRNYRVIFLLLFLVVLLIAGGLIYFASNSEQEPSGNQQVDSELRNDLGIVRGALATYKTRNGSFPNLTPEAVDELRSDLLPLEFNSPRTDEPYVLVTQPPAEGEVQYVLGGICDSEGSITQTGSEQTFALLTYLTDGSVYCLDRDERPQDEQTQ